MRVIIRNNVSTTKHSCQYKHKSTQQRNGELYPSVEIIKRLQLHLSSKSNNLINQWADNTKSWLCLLGVVLLLWSTMKWPLF